MHKEDSSFCCVLQSGVPPLLFLQEASQKQQIIIQCFWNWTYFSFRSLNLTGDEKKKKKIREAPSLVPPFQLDILGKGCRK